jgi:putative hydrolase of the HAD superfamily
VGSVAAASPEALLAEIDVYRHWYWSDPERHRRGRLDMTRARREIVAASLQRLGIDDEALAEQIAGAFTAARDAAICLFPDAVPTLEGLRDVGVRLGLITNGRAEDQRAKIERFALAPWFEFILIEGEFGCGKPDARVYQHALAQLRLPPGEVWMVGDNLEWDVAAPQQLGIAGIWHDVEGNGLPANSTIRPNRIIRSVRELVPQKP